MPIYTNSLTANHLTSTSLYANKGSGHLQWHSPSGLAVCCSSTKFELYQATLELEQEENTRVCQVL